MGLVSGFNHLCVHVTDLDRSEAFYCDTFGLDSVGRDLVNEEGANSLLKTNNGHLILLVQVEKVVPIRPNSMTIHHAFYLTPEQYTRVKERRRAAGFEVGDTRTQFRAKGELSFDVYDPDGHRYQIQAVGPEAAETYHAAIGKVVCGEVEDFAIGSVTHFPEGQFFLLRRADGFLALSHWCTHMNGVIRWRENYEGFFCPMHYATFNRVGESTSHRPYPPLRTHPVSITPDGIVEVDTDEVVKRRRFAADQLTPCAAREAAPAAAK
jgi:catechol 2,3-dioxygenase-like lactoylglutathione lyase family enzyme